MSELCECPATAIEDGRCRQCGLTAADREAVRLARDVLGIEVQVYRF